MCSSDLVDCGNLVTPRIAEHQMQSGITYGLTDALLRELTIQNGAIVEGNFDTYPLLKITQMPTVSVYMALAGGEKWGGMGEPATPPAAPAMANAVFMATGKRIRETPFARQDLSWS